MRRILQWFVLMFVVTAAASAQPAVDGLFDSGEWSGARTYPLVIERPEGGTTPGKLYSLNDSTDLYIAVRYERTTIDAITEVGITFDWQGDGIYTDGDDSVGLQGFACPAPVFYDGFIGSSTPPCELAGICNTNDISDGGTEDGAGAIGRDGIMMTYELRHPLNSGDPHDMAVTSGTTMELSWTVNLANLVTGTRTWGSGNYEVQ